MPRKQFNLVYHLARFCLRSSQPEFFRRIHIEGTPLDDPQEHLLVVANHPYGIQDAFLLSYAFTRPFYFVATALNFQRREGDVIKPRRLRGWFLRQCNVLPIVRNRAEGHMSTNQQTFDQAARAVADGFALGIFAEGDSRGNQWGLLKLKAGAAQIALQIAQLLADDPRRLRIQVVGLTYTNWNNPFKSTVTLRFAEPFTIQPIDLQDRVAVRAARKQITEQLTELLTRNTVQIPEEHRELVGKLARFYTVNQRSDYERLKRVSEHVEMYTRRFDQDREELEGKLDEYLALADELKVYPGEERVRRNPWLLVLGALPAAVGVLFHGPIVWLTARLVPLETTPLHSIGDKRVACGLLLTMLWYATAAGLTIAATAPRFGWWSLSWACAVIALLGFCGLASSRWFRHVVLFWRGLLPSRRRFRRYRQLGKELYERLEEYRYSQEERAVSDENSVVG